MTSDQARGNREFPGERRRGEEGDHVRARRRRIRRSRRMRRGRRRSSRRSRRSRRKGGMQETIAARIQDPGSEEG